MTDLQKFTAALDERLGQLRIDMIADFAPSTREEEKSFFDGVPDGIPFPKGGIGLDPYEKKPMTGFPVYIMVDGVKKYGQFEWTDGVGSKVMFVELPEPTLDFKEYRQPADMSIAIGTALDGKDYDWMKKDEALVTDNISGYRVEKDWSTASLKDVPEDWMPNGGEVGYGVNDSIIPVKYNDLVNLIRARSLFKRIFPTERLAKEYLDGLSEKGVAFEEGMEKKY